MKLPGHSEVTSGFDAECRATREILDLVGDKWSVLVVVNLGTGTMRFSALLRTIAGVSKRMLTVTLRRLERDGLVERRVYATVPATVEYDLTPQGRTLLEPVTVLATWAQANRLAIHQAREAYDASAGPAR